MTEPWELTQEEALRVLHAGAMPNTETPSFAIIAHAAQQKLWRWLAVTCDVADGVHYLGNSRIGCSAFGRILRAALGVPLATC